MRKNPTGGPDRIRVTSHAKSLLSASLALPPLGEPLERARKNDARAGNEIAFSQYDVGGEIVRSPTLEERGNERPELGEEIDTTQRRSCASSGGSATAGLYRGYSARARPARPPTKCRDGGTRRDAGSRWCPRRTSEICRAIFRSPCVQRTHRQSPSAELLVPVRDPRLQRGGQVRPPHLGVAPGTPIY